MKYSSTKLAIIPLALLIAFSITSCNNGSSNSTPTSPMIESCVLIDNDYDIDDMMAIPLVIGNKYVAAIIQSEGYTYPESSTPAINQLVNNLPDQPNQRKIPIIVGASQAQTRDISRWPWVQFFRSMMNLSNGLLESLPMPVAPEPTYVNQVVNSLASCKNVSVLIIGTYTSFINYSPLIRNKIDKVVIMGQPIGDTSRTPTRESFNCDYDLPACQQAMGQLQGLNTFFVDIPRISGCDTDNPPSSCYSPSYEMVAGDNGVGGLTIHGLPGRLKEGLMNNIQCSSFYTTPDTIGNPCSSKSTWVPAAVHAGPGGEMLLWDETAALFLLHPEIFSLYYPADPNIPGGLHYEPTLINESYGQTIQNLRRLWTEDTNHAESFQ